MLQRSDRPARTVCANPDQYLFWDSLHPTAAAHRILGNYALAALSDWGVGGSDGDPTEVPEPATLVLLAGACSAWACCAAADPEKGSGPAGAAEQAGPARPRRFQRQPDLVDPVVRGGADDQFDGTVGKAVPVSTLP